MADSMPGRAIFALIDAIGIASMMVTRLSKIVLPNKKNILSGIPMAMFQRMKMIKSMIDARQHVTFIKMNTCRNLHPLKKFWYRNTARKFTIDLTMPVTVM